MLLTWMAQAFSHDGLGHIRTPAGEGLNNAEVDVIQL